MIQQPQTAPGVNNRIHLAAIHLQRNRPPEAVGFICKSVNLFQDHLGSQSVQNYLIMVNVTVTGVPAMPSELIGVAFKV